MDFRGSELSSKFLGSALKSMLTSDIPIINVKKY